MNKNNCQPHLTWNYYSGISGPLMTMLGCLVLLFIPQKDRPMADLFPFLILLFSSILALGFWIALFAYIHRRINRPMIIAIGGFFQRLIILSQVLLIAGTIFRIFPMGFAGFKVNHPADNLYWIITFWAWLETTHHGVYKLLFGPRNALFEMEVTSLKDLTKPLGGSIGVMVRKLKS